MEFNIVNDLELVWSAAFCGQQVLASGLSVSVCYAFCIVFCSFYIYVGHGRELSGQ